MGATEASLVGGHLQTNLCVHSETLLSETLSFKRDDVVRMPTAQGSTSCGAAAWL